MQDSGNNYTLDFVLPAGPTGPAGATGATGATGLQGVQGETGPTGPVPTISIGTVTAGAPGTDASVTIRRA